LYIVFIAFSIYEAYYLFSLLFLQKTYTLENQQETLRYYKLKSPSYEYNLGLILNI